MFTELVQELAEVLSSAGWFIEVLLPQLLLVLELEALIGQCEYLPELPWNDLVEYVQIVGYDKVGEPVTTQQGEKEWTRYLSRLCPATTTSVFTVFWADWCLLPLMDTFFLFCSPHPRILVFGLPEKHCKALCHCFAKNSPVPYLSHWNLWHQL